MYQPNLLLTKELPKNYIKKFELLFSLLRFPKECPRPQRRPPHPKYALLNALVYKNLRSIPTLLELTRELKNYPQVAQICGFSSFPSIERYSPRCGQRGSFGASLGRAGFLLILMRVEALLVACSRVGRLQATASFNEYLKTSDVHYLA